jgi:hypothetical protein
MTGRLLNFTDAEIREVLTWPGETFALCLRRDFGIEAVRDEDELVRWNVPPIPCAEVPRVGPVDRAAVVAHYRGGKE